MTPGEGSGSLSMRLIDCAPLCLTDAPTQVAASVCVCALYPWPSLQCSPVLLSLISETVPSWKGQMGNR